MATQQQTPSAPPAPTDEKPQISEDAKPTNEAQQVTAVEAIKQDTPKSVFVNSEPIREDQVQNAVKFLTHPRVRGSPVLHRRSFLERKGLTKEEIDEAFRRAPDPPPSSQTTSHSQDGQQATPNVQSQGQIQTLQPLVAAPAVVNKPAGMLARFHWYHAVIAVGVLAASSAGTAVLIKNSIIPRLKSWVRKIVLEEETDSSKKANAKPSLVEEAAAAAKAAAAAATDAARATQEIMNTRNEDKRYWEECMQLLGVQVLEMKSLSNSMRKLEGQTNNPARTYLADREDCGGSITSSRRPYANGRADYDSHSARSASPPASVEPSVAPHPKSYMEIMAMIQRGERPPNIREINDLPPNPNQQPTNPRIAPRSKPWDSSQAQVDGFNADHSAPWWQRKNPRFTEIENESGPPISSQTQINEQPPVQQRAWVPPQPPPVVMPEAAEAIRRPKPPAKIDEEAVDGQSESVSSGVSDELQRITKVSESGGEGRIGGGEGSVKQNTEIQEEEQQHHSQEGN